MERIDRRNIDVNTIQLGTFAMQTVVKSAYKNLKNAFRRQYPKTVCEENKLVSDFNPYMIHLDKAMDRATNSRASNENSQKTETNDCKNRNRPVTVAEACAGISATTQALRLLGIRYQHVWMSENDIKCQETLKANYGEGTGRLFGDFMKLDVKKDLAGADLFVCGFPCQSWSSLNRSDNVGIDARNLVAGVMKQMIKYIHIKSPRCFIIENVKGFMTYKDEFNKLMDSLKDNPKYFVHHAVLNSLDFGVPQSRTRVYIVGVLRNDFKRGFSEWVPPEPSTPEGLQRVHISTILEKDQPMDVSPFSETNRKTLNHWAETKADLWTEPYVVGLNQSAKFSTAYNGYCPMLSKSHSNAMFLTNERRFLNKTEIYRLQGFPDSFIKHVQIGAWKNQVGNTMSVPVLCAVLQSVKDVTTIFD